MNREKLKEAIVENLDKIVGRLPKGVDGVIDVKVVLTTGDSIYEINAEFVDMKDESWELESIDCHEVV